MSHLGILRCILFYFIFQIENLMMEVPFPKTVLNVTLTPSQGKYTFDPVSKVMSWDVGRIDTTKLPNIKGNVCIPKFDTFLCLFVCLMVFNATFNNISVISWRSVLLVEKNRGLRENHRPFTSHWQTLSHNVVHLTLIEIWTHNISGDRHWLYR